MPKHHKSWFTSPEDYDAIHEVVGNHADYPDTYDEWLKLATKQVADIKLRGTVVNKMIVNSYEFAWFCDRKQLDRDFATLGAFIVAKAAGQNY